MVNIKNLDLNLLVVFDALMRERNATRAASRVGLSQPAVSAALRRLRAALGDPLLVRTRGGMQPTPRAEEFFASIARSLDGIQLALQSGAAFVPARAERSFDIMLSDVGEIIYLPRLIKYIQREAPNVHLTIRRLARPLVQDELASGNIDLAIGWISRPRGLRQEILFDEDFVAVVRAGHPRIGKRMTPAQFTTESHLVVGRKNAAATSPLLRAAAEVDRTLPDVTHPNRIAMQVPHYLGVPSIIASTDLVCVVPRQLGRIFVEQGRLRVASLPSTQTFAVSQFWHKRFENDEANMWLRKVIRRLFGRATTDKLPR